MPSAAPTDDGRLPRGWVPAAYLDHLPSILGLMLAGTLFVLRPDVWPGPAALWVIGPLLALRLLDPWYERLTVRLEVRDDAITLVSGLVHRRTRTASWHDVRAVDVVEPWGHRLFDLARVTVAQAGGDDARIVVPAVDDATRARILELSEPYRARADDALAHADAAASSTLPRPDGALLYRATVRELLVASLVLGQFAVAGAAALAAAWELIDSVGLTDAALGAVAAGPLVVAIVGVLALTAVGGALTVARYWGFEVRAEDERAIVIRYGLVELFERRIDGESIAGVTLRRNLIELLLGRVRLGLLTTDSAAQLGTNLLLPSLPTATVDEVLRRILANQAPRVPVRGPAAALRGAALLLITIAPAGALLAALLSAGAALWFALVMALIVGLTTHAVARLLCSRLSFDEQRGTVTLLTRHASERHQVVRASAAHFVSSSKVLGRPVLARTHFYAGAARTLTAARFDLDDVTRLQGALARDSRAALQRRLARRSRG